MPCFNQRYIRQIDIFQLDSCGRIIAPSALSVLPKVKNKSITVTDAIQAGTEINETLSDGTACNVEPAAKALLGIDFELTGCGTNPALEAFLGFGTTTVSTGVVTDIAYGDYDSSAAVAIQVLYKASPLCTGATPSTVIDLYPYVTAWERTNPVTQDGNTAINDSFKGRAIKHGNLFTLTGGVTAIATLPPELVFWAANKVAINAGTKLKYRKIIASPADAALANAGVTSCEPIAISAALA